jgi:hypothetical protein
MFDAMMAIDGSYEPYLGVPDAPAGSSIKAAIAQAAHDTLVEMWPSQKSIFDQELRESLALVEDGQSKEDGILVGKLSAQQILNERNRDGSELSAPGLEPRYDTQSTPGTWRADPFHPNQRPLTPEWGKVQPFIMTSSYQYRVPPPPDMRSAEYAEAYDEVKRLGGDGISTPTERNEDQTVAGFYWGYDGTPSLCAPPKLYNQIAVQIAEEQKLNVIETARLLTMVNVAMADAGIASWESKYYWNIWRPVTGIRESDPGTGPSGRGDGNTATIGDPNFSPLGAPAVNGSGRNFTPPFPAYPSGHATFGGALFEVLRNYLGRDDYRFTFVSEEFNGITTDQYGKVRPLLPRTFLSFSQAEEENGQSRIYLGIHWKFDKVEGIVQGRKIADLVSSELFAPRR